MTNIKAILFDLDQTLLDRNHSLELFLSCQWDGQAALHKIPKTDYISKFVELDDNGKLWKDKVYQQLLHHFNIKDTNPALLLEEYLTIFSKHATLFPDVIKVLNELKSKNIKLGIITNGRTDLQSSVIKATGLEPLMDTILISETEKVKKPGSKIFQSGIDHLGIRASECIFIGDNPDADIKGAYNFGMKTIWKQNGQHPAPSPEITSAILHDFKDLPEIINSIETIS